MTDAEVLRQINRRLDKQDELLAEIREAQIKHETAYDEIKPALEEVVTFWKGSRILARILGALAALAAFGAAFTTWAKDHLK